MPSASPMSLPNDSEEEARAFFAERCPEIWREQPSRQLVLWFPFAATGLRAFRDLRSVAQLPNQERLIAGLLENDWEKVSATLMELRMAAMIHRGGRPVSIVEEDSDKRTPDLRVDLGGHRLVAIECTSMRFRDAQIKASNLLSTLSLNAAHLGRAGKRGYLDVRFAHRHVVRSDTASLLAAMEAMGPSLRMREVGDGVTMTYVECNEPFTVGSSTGIPEFTVRHLHQMPDFHRIRRKLHDKEGQLALDDVGVLAIRTNLLLAEVVWTGPRLVGELALAAPKLARSLERYPHVSALLVFEEWRPGVQNPQEIVLDDLGLRCSTALSPDGVGRVVVLIRNPAARAPLRPEEVDALVGPRMLW